MALTGRGKVAVAVGAVALVVGVVGGALALGGSAPGLIQRAIDTVTGEDEPPPVCPLTGRLAAGGVVPDRPALAVKIENAPEARPQTGLQHADIVYEEPVEGGLTRFIVLYHCGDGGAIGPVRSARTTDADVLSQFGKPLIAYAGGANRVRKALEETRVVDLSYTSVPGSYRRDGSRAAPHNLYSSTKQLWAAAEDRGGRPRAVFAYARALSMKAKRVREVHLEFSWASDVYWRWDQASGRWARFHGDEAHLLTQGGQVTASNVVVQVVKVEAGDIIDAAGNPSPEVSLTGKGKAYVFRNGRVIVGKWVRPSLNDRTRFIARSGGEIPLAPGTTWVELFPAALEIETAK